MAVNSSRSLWGLRSAGLGAAVVTAVVAGPFGGIALAAPQTPVAQLSAPGVAARHQPAHGSLLAEIRRELAAMHSSHYQHQTKVNERRGQFNYDCSG